MHLDLVRDKSKGFPQISDPLRIRTARIWHCKYSSVGPLAVLQNLEELVIATYPDESFAPLGQLRALRYLWVLHFPRVSDLTPIQLLERLETLSLSSLPSWDASGKVLSVASLEPIGRLANLRYLELFGVRPPDKKLSPLLRLKGLRSARFSKYPKDEMQRFYSTTGVSDAFAPRPTFSAA